jgi:hypothetical protein
MSAPADSGGATARVAKVLYTIKYDAGANFILFALAVKLKALIE